MSNSTGGRKHFSEGRIVREMGCGRSEFMRWLPGATRQAVLHSSRHGEQDRHRIVTPGGTVVITAVAPRRIASMTLPVLQVAFHFIDMDARAQADFMRYFDLYTRRGGG